jgi:eukaryotic-like serine/threonine-protein kinase
MGMNYQSALWQQARVEVPAALPQLGKYRLVATLGQGGMGTVYLALVRGPGEFRKLLVVKELRAELTQRASFITMFMDEARLAARLDHPNVVQTFEVGEEAGRYFLAMEYLDGQPLNALIERARKTSGLPLSIHIQILCEVLTGLHYAHELCDYDGSSLHVVHRDVSPQNVFITHHGQVKVVDFGVAKVATANSLTSPGVFKGKFAYAAPEQTMGHPVDARCDVFAVGVMLWEAIAGRRFAEQTPTVESFRARNQGSEPRIAEVAPDVDRLLAEISDKALAVDPAQRYPSAEAFRLALQEYLLLSGERVEGAQIGELSRALFQEERRAIHQVIERAMASNGASRSSVAALPFLRASTHTEDSPTTVADLSSLVQVSHEADDDKIRAGYAYSRVTAPAYPAPRATKHTWRWVGAACALGLCGLGLWLMAARTRPAVPAHGVIRAARPQPSAADARATPVPSALRALNRNGEVNPGAADRASPSAGSPPAQLDVAAVEPASVSRLEPKHAKRAASTAQRRERMPHDTASALGGASEAQRPPPAGSEPAMGSDLHSTRNGTRIRIDIEDPYR